MSSDTSTRAERDLIRFELGESVLMRDTAPVDTSALAALGARFAAEYDSGRDLRFLNAVLKILDREAFARLEPEAHRHLTAWADAAMSRFRFSCGLA